VKHVFVVLWRAHLPMTLQNMMTYCFVIVVSEFKL